MSEPQTKIIEIVNYNGNIYVFTKDEREEPMKIFRERIWWILNHMKDISELDNLLNLSYIWANMKHYNVKYNESIIKRIESL